MMRYLLVILITTFSFVFGVLAVYFALGDHLYFSFGFALMAMFFDSIDGYLARRLKAESRTGAILDTVADIVVYLIYPAVVFYYVFEIGSPIGLLLIGIFVSSGIYRLLRFSAIGFLIINEKKYYSGMPVFFSHFMIIMMMLINTYNQQFIQIIGPILLVIISALMVTKYKFIKPQGIYLLISLFIILVASFLMFSI